MPTVYLSPSTQPLSLYATGGSEQEWMQLLTDHMEPYLTAAGIQYARKSPDLSAEDAILQSNAGDYDLHLALHSGVAPDSLSGTLRGIHIYYYPGSPSGSKAANLIAGGLRRIYPLPELVQAEPSDAPGELRYINTSAALVEVGYHDNIADSLWIQNNLNNIAQNIATSLADYFGTPALSPTIPVGGVVSLSWGHLNVRELPDINAPIIATAANGTPVTILNTFGNWHLIQFGNIVGYASTDYITPA